MPRSNPETHAEGRISTVSGDRRTGATNAPQEASRTATGPRVSIIVPVYNGEKYVRESLDSILAQTYPDVEVLVMDDASTDGTAAILDSYRDRVQIFRQPTNRGIYENANDGIAMARGEYIAIYHADDVYMPTIVEREVEFLDRHVAAGAVFCNMKFIGPAGEEFGQLELPDQVNADRPLDYSAVLNALLNHTNHFLMCPTAMIRASVYKDVGVYRQDIFRNTSDMEMWLRIAQKYPMGVLNERLIRYRHFHDSSSMRYHKLRTEPGRYFTIVDLYLDAGGRSLVTSNALAAHEAHRAQDLLMVAVSNYILDRRQDGRALLSKVRASRILASSRIQRGRMFVLFVMLHVLLRVPRIRLVADVFYRRWHQKSPPKGSAR